MQIATIQKKKISTKQLRLYGIIGGFVVLIVAALAIFFLIQGISTQATEEEPLNVIANPVDANNATVTWETGKDTIAVVEYGTVADPATFREFAFSEIETTAHAVTLSSLEPNTTYYFQIRIGDTVYDNGGSYWSVTTPAGAGGDEDSAQITPPLSVTLTGAPEATPSPQISATPSATIVPTPVLTATPSATVIPTPTPLDIFPYEYDPTPTVSSDSEVTPAVCTSSNCTSILQSLGNSCTTQDYVRCLLGGTQTTVTPAATTATPTPISQTLKNTCAITSIQANSCTSWVWNTMSSISGTCASTFTKYFVQCKSSSFESTDAATWYCNETVDTNQLTVPCTTAPTPPPGQSVFCRVRAETAEGGADNATAWMYGSTSCPTYGSLSGVSNCQINYLQQNTCGKWSWSLNNPNDPQCLAALDHYFLQCTTNGIFSSPGALTPTPYWYCNNTTKDRYLNMPCDIAITPADGSTLTCRVRPEDGYGTDAHAGSWTTTTATCPTSTPTPTPSPTETPTPTPTPTFTPTPTP